MKVILRKIIQELLTWVDMILIWMPGILGVKIRHFFYRIRFKKCGPNINFSQGCRIKGFENISLDRSVYFGPYVQMYAEECPNGIEIGANTGFNSNVMINADKSHGIKIGDYVLVGPNVIFRAADHVFESRETPIRDQGHEAGRIVVENDVWIAANAIILKDVTIKRGAVIGAGAVVTHDVGEYEIVAGVPARVIGKRGEVKCPIP